MVASASAAPPAAAPGRNHPTYTNMITHALAQLGGASARSAIAGFISASFTGLPVSHDALLTAHLRRLVAEGVLCTSGFSFVFSDHSPTRPAEATDLDSDDESAGDSADDDDDDDAYTPLLHLPVRVPVLGEKRGRGRPRKTVEGSPANAGGVRRPRGRPRKVMVMLSAHTNTTTSAQPCPAKGEHSVLSSQRDGVTKRGRGRPRKIQQSTSPSPGGDPSTACIIKRGPGRPRKEDQQSEATKHLPTPPASRGFKVGCGRPMLVAPASASADTWPPMSWRPIIIDKLPPARCSIDPLAESARVKRPRGRPRIYTPSAAMSAETGDPETVDAASMGIKRGHGWPIKENPSAAAAMLAETEAGDAVSMGIKRGRGRTRKEKPAAAAAMLSETGDDAVPMGTKGALEIPNPRTEKISAGDIMSMVMKRGRGRPRKDQQSQALTIPTASTGGIKIGHGRPREDQQSQPKPPLTPLVSRRGIKVGCGRPMIIERPPAARWPVPVDAALSGIKRPRGRPRKVTPSVAMSAPETGDAMSAPETGDSTSAPVTGDAVHAEAGDAASAVMKRGRGRPRKERPDAALSVGMKRGMSGEAGDATPGPETGRATATAIKRGRGRPRKERPDAALSVGMKKGRGRPRKEKPEARMCGASMGFKRWGGQREAGMDMLAAAAAAMLAEIGDDAVATGWKQGS